MNALSDFLKSVDMFGVSMSQEYNKGESQYKTKIGGVATIIIYLLSAAYAFYIMALWFDKAITPKISNQSYLSDFQLLDLDYDLIRVSYWKYGEDIIDPFAANVLSAHMFFWSGPLDNSTSILEFNNGDLTDEGAIQALPKIKLEFDQDENGQVTVSSDFYIFFGPCIQEELPHGVECASSSIVQEFFAQPMNCIQITLNFKRISPMTGTEQILSTSYFVQFEDINCQLQNFFFKTKMYEVKDSLIYGDPTLYELVDDVVSSNQVNSIGYCENIFKMPTYAAIYLNLNNLQTMTSIEFSNIGELLANIGSVVSILFLSRYLIVVINAHYFEQDVLNQLIAYYYPQYKEIRVKYGWRNQIIQVSQGDKLLDPEDFLKFRTKANQIMRTKLSVGNILYELSRITLVIRSLFPREKLYKVHKTGIQLRINALNDTSFELQQYTSEDILKDEDCDIFSVDQRDVERQELNDGNVDFFDINKIDANIR